MFEINFLSFFLDLMSKISFKKLKNIFWTIIYWFRVKHSSNHKKTKTVTLANMKQ